MADEDDLCRLWAAHALPAAALVTTGGDRLQVIYPGRRSGTGGPDFQDAILADGSGRMHAGDVELHLRSRDWIAHGHRADPAYNRVVLHVVLEDDGLPCLRADGTPVPVLSLGALLAAPLQSAARLPTAQPCRVAPALQPREVGAIVHAAGRRRLEEKATALEAQIVALGAEQALFTALLDAAGYSRNRAPCAALAQRLPVDRLQDVLSGKEASQAAGITTAILLGLAGLLPPDAGDLLSVWTHHADLWPLPPLRADAWVRAGVRPANRPELRLRGLALLVARCARDGLASTLLAPVRLGDAAGLLAQLEVQVPAPTTTTTTARDERLPPIGPGRAVDMAINVVVPFALALARSGNDAELEAGAWRSAELLPGGEDSAPLRHMLALLKSSGHRLRAPSALHQQGLLHLYRTYCSVRACWDCPLANG